MPIKLRNNRLKENLVLLVLLIIFRGSWKPGNFNEHQKLTKYKYSKFFIHWQPNKEIESYLVYQFGVVNSFIFVFGTCYAPVRYRPFVLFQHLAEPEVNEYCSPNQEQTARYGRPCFEEQCDFHDENYTWCHIDPKWGNGKWDYCSKCHYAGRETRTQRPRGWMVNHL